MWILLADTLENKYAIWYIGIFALSFLNSCTWEKTLGDNSLIRLRYYSKLDNNFLMH